MYCVAAKYTVVAAAPISMAIPINDSASSDFVSRLFISSLILIW